MKAPNFEFDPLKWKNDGSLSRCRPGTRGIWIDLICNMQIEAHTAVEGTLDQLARSCRCTPIQMENAIDDLRETQTADVVLLDGGTPRYRISCRRITRNPPKPAGQPKRNVSSELPDDPTFDLKAIQDEWNSIHGLPKVQTLSEKRRAALRARLRDKFWRENWQNAIRAIPACPFLMGNNNRKWVADFEFFLRPDSVAKIMEGRYMGPENSPSSATRAERQQMLMDMESFLSGASA